MNNTGVRLRGRASLDRILEGKKMHEMSKKLFGEMMVLDGVITQEQLDEALAIQEELRKEGSEVKRIGVILRNLGHIQKETIEVYVNKVIYGTFAEKLSEMEADPTT